MALLCGLGQVSLRARGRRLEAVACRRRHPRRVGCLISTDRSANGAVWMHPEQACQPEVSAGMVENTYRRDLGGRGHSITGRALSQFEGRLATLLESASAWLRIVTAKPDGAGRTGAAVERLRRDFDELAPAARSAIGRVQRASPVLPLASALIRALDAISSLHGILGREPDVDVPVGPSRHCPTTYSSCLTSGSTPTGTSTSPHQASGAGPYARRRHPRQDPNGRNARLDQGDLHGAYAVCARMAAEADPAEDVSRERLDGVLAEERHRLRRQLDQFVQMLEQVGKSPMTGAPT